MTWELVVLAALMFGINTVFWASVGLCRLAARSIPRPRHNGSRRRRPLVSIPGRKDVAILMAAHNEASVIEASVRSACRLVQPSQVFVVSDGSTDDTVAIVRRCGANVLDLQPNRGKAGALAAAVNDFHLADRFRVVLILDADTELSSDYLDTGLAMFADPRVAVVAGRATTQWNPRGVSLVGRAVVAHRERIYVAVQWLVKYGQAAARFDAVTIAPGFASMYLSHVLSKLEINPPGLVIEDFNMTFEIHRQRLGRIAFHPGAAIARTQDPHTMRDYRKQTRRWALGFWQTVRLHGLLHRGAFWPLLTLYCLELLVSAVALLATWVLVLGLGLMLALNDLLGTHLRLSFGPSFPMAVVVLLVPDLLLTLLVTVLTRRLYLLAAAPAYPLLRLLDAWTCIGTLAASFWVKSSGTWQSPARQTAPPLSTQPFSAQPFSAQPFSAQPVGTQPISNTSVGITKDTAAAVPSR